ncbi:MAG TPA: Gfo/Idh/MocA family oxidoreductase, partial [Phycisphaerae bacterium]|nr:Gfo/Idh/MocA family oxidoreductase [Phycisphaerae bacterium]
KFNRRSFLKSSLAAGALAATSRSRLFAAEAPRRGANEKIRIAVIGFNGQGGSHIRQYAGMDDVEIVALCDVDRDVWPKGLKPIEEKGKPTPKCFQDMRRVFDDKTIDAVSIATPNHWHALAAIWAMQSGKDVYVEKPVSHNVLEGRRMVEAARKYQRICQTGTQIRSNPGSIEAIQYVREGKIGKLLVARGLCYKRRDSIGLCGGPQEPPPNMDYDLWSGPAPLKPPHRKTDRGTVHYHWHWFWDYGNGDLGNQGIHQMDVARWGIGADRLPDNVIAFGGRLGYKDDGETPNTEIAFMEYGDVLLIFETRGLPTPNYRGAMVGNVFHGTEGSVVLTSYSRGAAFDKDGKKIRNFDGGGNHHRNFIDAVRSRKYTDLKADILEGHLSSALCHLANISYLRGTDVPFSSQHKAFGDNKEAYETFERTMEHLKENKVPMDGETYRLGKKLIVDAANERFVGDEKANALLTREYREPFVVPNQV